MHTVKVLVVDDSAAMRALFCDILEKAKGVEVVGAARGADEARDMITSLRPDVLTLDVEMPGMSGLEFLTEIMEERPMPVVMLSSVTQSGTGTAQKALDLGAFACFPKPLRTSPEEFNAVVQKLGSLVIKAATAKDAKPSAPASQPETSMVPNGTAVVISGGSGAVDVVREVLATYPANCPPTVITLDAETEGAGLIARLDGLVACQIKAATDGCKLEPGVVYIANNGGAHAIMEGADTIRLSPRDPVAGVRPSGDLLFGTAARGLQKAICILLENATGDGAKGFKMAADAGLKVIVQKPRATGAVAGHDTARRLVGGAEVLEAGDLGARIMSEAMAEVALA
ncbi:chemotaxis protein CheB [Qipengyuania sp.]|uniref:chemotaxis protein CheB n=1 Tax=Qipengyuania sp. TaxID=2004515 RepID=UPI0035C7E997